MANPQRSLRCVKFCPLHCTVLTLSLKLKCWQSSKQQLAPTKPEASRIENVLSKSPASVAPRVECVQQPQLERKAATLAPRSLEGAVGQSIKAASKETEVPVARAPWDWTPKTKCRVASKHSFAWLDRVQRVGRPQAVENFAAGKPCEDSYDPEEMFGRACLYWAHPTFSLPKTLLDMHNDPNSELAGRRKSDWQEAFHSAFDQLEAHTSQYFHVVFTDFTVVFFRERSPLGVSSLRACISRASRGVRHRLTSAGIAFEAMQRNGGLPKS